MAAEELPVKGKLCFQATSAPCVDTTGSTVEVPSADTERHYVWLSADGARAVAGILEPNATSIDVAGKDLREIKTSIRGDSQRGWPADVRVTFRSRKLFWDFTLPAESVTKFRELRLPLVSSEIGFEAAHHRTLELRLFQASNPLSREIVLQPLPIISGRIVTTVDEKPSPLAGVQISSDDGKVLTHADEQGAFRVELSEPVPDAVLVNHPGYGTRVLDLSDLEAENNLGTITLSKGVKLTLQVDRPESIENIPVTLRLEQRSRTRKTQGDTLIAQKTLTGEETVQFTDLAAGEYWVVLKGKEPLEQLKERVDIESSDVEEKIEIKPYRLTGTVRFGDEPLQEGQLSIDNQKVPIEKDGTFGGTAWQHGKLLAWINSPAVRGLPPVRSPELGADPSEWNIVIRRRLITGRVADEETGQPPPRVSIQLQTRPAGGGGGLYTGVPVAANGEYSIVAVEDGFYDMKVNVPGYLFMEKTVEMNEADEGRRVDFLLSRGMEVSANLVWPTGQPVAEAQVMEGVSRDGHNPQTFHRVDAQGRLILRARPGETRALHVLPREGSFAVIRLVVPPPGAEMKLQRFIVPAPVGSLAVSMVDEAGNPGSGRLMMRFNGEWIPYSVIGRLATERLGSGGVRLLKLPAGAYELWAVDAQRAFREPATTPPPTEPVRVGLSGGDEAVRLVVKK